jgi:hypothetical protein
VGCRAHINPLAPRLGGLKVNTGGWLLVLAVVLSLCACAPATLPATLTATPLPPRATLPPTWTPTRTPTPLPPTATATLTPTPTATPTVNPDTLCDQFWVETNLDKGRILGWEHRMTFFVTLPAGTGLTLRFVAVHQMTQQQKEVEAPAETAIILQMLVNQLPLPGHYDWTLSLHSETFGELCPQHGWFIAAGRESTRAEERRVR